jgi:hypothetical protein
LTAIDAKARNVRELLGGKKYTIDYFQREYRWQTKHMAELISDLSARFLSAWKPAHGRGEVAKYPTYFLGSIIVSSEGGKASVIDGQQRLTSLSILLIWVLHGLQDEDDRKQIADLIFTRQFGSNAYNLEVPERTGAMDALYKQELYNRDNAPESVRNILDRYEDVEEQIPIEIATKSRAMFADWLIEKVYLVEISAPSDDDGYAIFETMNDRGLPLSPTDMLKSHLLANAGNDDTKKRLNSIWKGRIDELVRIGKEEDSDAIKSWLRARYANSIRAREAGAGPQDYDLIGTEFHRWVRDNGDRLQLTKDKTPLHENFAKFIEREFDFYARWYLDLRAAAQQFDPSREVIYCNALANFTLQYPVMLAPIGVTDGDDVGWRKAMTVATYIDILMARRVWSGSSIDYNTMQYAMFLILKEVRGLEAIDIATVLKAKLDAEPMPFIATMRFGLSTVNKKTVRRFLARMTNWLDEKIGHVGSLVGYLTTAGPQGYDVEHIMEDQYERYKLEYSSEAEFYEQRNRIGALLLLPKSFNRSYGDMKYGDKAQHYLGQNSLARTLCQGAYVNNPGLRRVIEERGVLFKPHSTFGRTDLEEREKAIASLAEQVWHTDRILAEATGP